MFSDLAWQDTPPTVQEWFGRYAAYRYGGADPHATRAWDLLAGSAYAETSGEWSEPQDGLFNARPSLDVSSAAAWSPPAMRYRTGVFEQAAAELLQVRPALKATSAWRHDVVDMARQALSDHAREMLPMLREAYQGRDLAGFRAMSKEWLTDMALLDRLLATAPEFLLGRWLQPALAEAGHDADEEARLRYDQLSLITHWGERSGADKGQLHDYANRELAGLVGTLYRARWQRYFASLEKALADGGAPEVIDWFAMEQDWSRRQKTYPVTPTGDPGRVAAEVVAHLRAKRFQLAHQ
nr:alpha-N-acetylglucosaminidase C-terminal domain-containing protein [Massilia terrae]